jgi:hypothetical protein
MSNSVVEIENINLPGSQTFVHIESPCSSLVWSTTTTTNPRNDISFVETTVHVCDCEVMEGGFSDDIQWFNYTVFADVGGGGEINRPPNQYAFHPTCMLFVCINNVHNNTEHCTVFSALSSAPPSTTNSICTRTARRSALVRWTTNCVHS